LFISSQRSAGGDGAGAVGAALAEVSAGAAVCPIRAALRSRHGNMASSFGTFGGPASVRSRSVPRPRQPRASAPCLVRRETLQSFVSSALAGRSSSPAAGPPPSRPPGSGIVCTTGTARTFSRVDRRSILTEGPLCQPVPCPEDAVKRLLPCCALAALVGALFLSLSAEAGACP